MPNKKPNKKEYATKEDVKDILLEFADKTLLPGISDMMDRSIAKATYELKTYVDDKLGDQTAEVFARMDRKFAEQDKRFEAMDKRFDEMDTKFTEQHKEVCARLDRRDEKDSAFKKSVVTIFKREKIGTKEEIGFLEHIV